MFKVAILQKRPINEQIDKNIETIIMAMEEASENHAQVCSRGTSCMSVLHHTSLFQGTDGRNQHRRMKYLVFQFQILSLLESSSPDILQVFISPPVPSAVSVSHLYVVQLARSRVPWQPVSSGQSCFQYS